LPNVTFLFLYSNESWFISDFVIGSLDSTGVGLEDGWPPISPSYAYRTIIRKPVIRMPTSSDSDIYPHHSISPQRRMSLREFKSGSLDRHTHLTPMDLFNESKLRRVNTSMTSLSTPSFKSRKDQETKGPCFMGLCLPKELDMLFLPGSVHTPITHVSLGSKSGNLFIQYGVC